MLRSFLLPQVRKSLETLSVLIHDRTAAVGSSEMGDAAAHTYVPDKDSPLDASSFDRS